MLPAPDLSTLPPLVQELVLLLGLDATMALVRRWRYMRLYVPARPAPDHPISLAIGPDAARCLADWLRDEKFREHLDVPGCADALRAVRDAAILEAASTGTTNDLVARFVVSRRTVFYAKERAAATPAEAPLFDLFSLSL